MSKKNIAQFIVSILTGLVMVVVTLLLVSTASAKGNVGSPLMREQAQAGTGVVSVPVYVLVYGDPAARGINVKNLTEGVMQHLVSGTMHHGYKDPAAAPYVHFEIYDRIHFVTPTVMATTPKRGNGRGDYHAIYFDNPFDKILLANLAIVA